MNERLAGLAAERGVHNLQVVLADLADPKIPEPVDLIFISNAYHHIDDRVTYFGDAARYLKPGGRLAVLEYKQEGFFQFFFRHATDHDVITDELGAAGYELVGDHDYLQRQHLMIFSPADH